MSYFLSSFKLFVSPPIKYIVLTLILTLFVLGFLLVIVEIIVKIVRNSKCLDSDDIADFMSNQLTENERDYVIAHLGRCKKCQERLHEYNFGKKIEDHLIAPEE